MSIKFQFIVHRAKRLIVHRAKLLWLAVFLAITLVAAASYVLVVFPSQSIALTEQQLYRVNKGMGFNQLCRDLVKQQVIVQCGPLKWFTKFSPNLRLIKAGLYQLEPNISHRQLLEILTSGVEYQFDFTIVEGERWRDVVAKLANSRELNFDIEDQQQLSRLLNNPYDSLEGLLYPDTYYYAANSRASDLVRRAYLRMDEKLDYAWQNRAADLPYDDRYAALIMASIIEKETGQGFERPMIASVFVNRLRKKMRLQTDPTVIYGLGERFDGDITRAHLRQKTPYNTYRINGLPPTPIAMPALAAINAALNPDDTPYLYFVSKKDGTHQFSTTLKEHNRAVRYYQLGQGQRQQGAKVN